jgi:hypothetical protein
MGWKVNEYINTYLVGGAGAAAGVGVGATMSLLSALFS